MEQVQSKHLTNICLIEEIQDTTNRVEHGYITYLLRIDQVKPLQGDEASKVLSCWPQR